MKRTIAGQDWDAYYRACFRHPEAVARLEQLLDNLNSDSVSVRHAADALTGYGTTFDQITEILRALQTVGGMKHVSDEDYVVDKVAYRLTQAQRTAVRDALSWAASRDTGACELLVATPSDAATIVGVEHATRFLDLRTTIRNLIADAKSYVLLAAPYWDLEVASDLAEILRRRQAAGIRVNILCRQPQPGSQNQQALTAIREFLTPSSSCEVRILEHPSRDDPLGTSTFHFKAVCVDDAHVYLGSANFNTAGLNSRWELGVRLSGQQALQVSRLIEALWTAARPLQW